MASIYGLVKRLYRLSHPLDPVAPSATPLKFGILSAARIAPRALLLPAKNHPDVVVHAVAARDQTRADTFAKKWKIPKAYGGDGAYQKLLDNPEVDVVYIPLPNSLHYEWTMKALAAGKHVLLEKPAADTAEETRKMYEFAEKKGLVLLEAFHCRFHPATHRAKEILDSGELGEIQSLDINLAVPHGLVKDDDIRLKYDLGGGCMMDMGCYTMSTARYLASADPLKVESATADTKAGFPKIDFGTTAHLTYPGAEGRTVPATLDVHFRLPSYFGFIPAWPRVMARVKCARGELAFQNYVRPHLYHYIRVKKTDERGKVVESRTEKRYGEGEQNGWSTYQFQLETLVDKIRGRKPQHWFDAQDSISSMQWIERVYEATSLGLRPVTTAEVPSA